MFFFTPAALAILGGKKSVFVCSTCSKLSPRLCFRCALLQNSKSVEHLLKSSNVVFQIDVFIPYKTVGKYSTVKQALQKFSSNSNIRIFTIFQKRFTGKTVFISSIMNQKPKHVVRISLGKTSVVDEDLKTKLRSYFDKIIEAMENVTPGHQQCIVFQQANDNDHADNVLIDTLISKEPLFEFYEHGKSCFP